MDAAASPFIRASRRTADHGAIHRADAATPSIMSPVPLPPAIARPPLQAAITAPLAEGASVVEQRRDAAGMVTPEAQDTPLVLGVLTANIHKGFDLLHRRFVLPQLREAIRGTGADLVFLQEVLGAHSGHARRHAAWPQAPHYEFLADSLWPQFAYGRNAIYPDGHHGNALLSMLPIASHENHDVSVAGHENRGLLHCRLHVPGGERCLHAICVHLGLREAHRRRQLDLLCAHLDAAVPADEPLIVAGDFNDWRSAGHRRLLRCGLTEVFEASRGRLARSFPVHWPLLPLDRIYVRGLVIVEAGVHSAAPWSRLSDHAVLSARLSLGGGEA
jgi:endonuclease/exonuclease/phosphatase family metal-dependent hydrolase